MTDVDHTQFDVLVVGSANLDLVATAPRLPGPGETVMGTGFAEHPGGKGLNQAVAAARAGARVGFVGAVGRDAAGAALLQVMHTDGIDTSGVAEIEAPTGRALIGVAESGENSIIVVSGANHLVAPATYPPAAVVLVQLEVPLSTVAAALAAGRAAGAVTVLNPAPAQPLDADLLAQCDVVVPNEHEVALLGGAERLLALGARAVVVTRGAAGADLVTADGVERHPSFTVDPIDTTGAGDAFCGALSARLAAGDELRHALRYALAGGALATTRAGAVPSMATLAEIEALLSGAA
jgi:ribokinase